MSLPNDDKTVKWKQNPLLSKQVVDLYNLGHKPKQIGEKIGIPGQKVRSHITALKKTSPQLFTQISLVPSSLSALKKDTNTKNDTVSDFDEDDDYDKEDKEEEDIDFTPPKKRKINQIPTTYMNSENNEVNVQITVIEESLTLTFKYPYPADTVATKLGIPLPEYHRKVDSFSSQHVVYTPKPIETNLKLIKKEIIDGWKILTIPWKGDDVSSVL